MRRVVVLLLMCFLLFPLAVGLAQLRSRPAAPGVRTAVAPTLVGPRGEHRSVVARERRAWIATHPWHAPRVPLLPFDWPANGSITGVCGNDGGRRHPGIDIGTLRSLRIRAAAPGRVVHAGYTRGFDGYGKVVVVRTGRFTLLYAHLSHVRVRAGGLLRRDERIGEAGCTGWCTGTHRHFEVGRGGHTLNPMRMLASAR